MTVVAALLVLFAGLAVGATSIGGILVVPVLTTVAGVPLREAIAASNFSFAFTGFAALAMQRVRAPAAGGEPAAPVPNVLYGAALAGAAAGALTLPWLPAAAARLVVAALALTSGAFALRAAAPSAASASTRLPAPVLVGFLVGCGSAWSGTGGPVMLLPILLLARVSPMLAVAAGQGVQLPIAGASTLVNLVSGQLDIALGLVLGGLLVAGWAAGWRLSRHISVASLRKVLAVSLIAVGLWYGWRTFKELFT